MPRRSKKGYFVDGAFVTKGSDLDLKLNHHDTPSKTSLKRQSQDLQKLGEALLQLRSHLFAQLHLPQRLQEALEAAQHIRDFEGHRRQMQFVGKLMREVDPEPIQAALQEQQKGNAQERQILYALERWREHLLSDEQALSALLQIFPDTNTQHLRSLLRQTRKNQATAQAESAAKQASRQSRLYRELLRALKALLQDADEATAKEFLCQTPQQI